LDEGKRIVDAPAELTKRAPVSTPAVSDRSLSEEPSASAPAQQQRVAPGDFTINFGRKYKGKRLKEISRSELESYVKWLEASAVRDGTSLSFQVQQLKNAFERLYGATEATVEA
jgi:hypothetical protein